MFLVNKHILKYKSIHVLRGLDCLVCSVRSGKSRANEIEIKVYSAFESGSSL